ncbi:uncharacterized protein LOC128206098 isoform X3 [Mya arenaria]|uniref:uncharacterized protein LOC128206070 isoform X3 n=2 Tax=Mya arenaria TaxID=6604 RepID=UPI0022E93A1F|nr:uncharacterized protein LOC128206070 isoform X3 [Mya arenaria]XP_052764228.1 uncharacterized protein LOC128206098 isoform X3 [Mya arenaria]
MLLDQSTMHILLALVTLVAVFGSLHVNGKESDSEDSSDEEDSSGSSDKDTKRKCFADPNIRNKCQKRRPRELFFFNSTSSQCEESSQCLHGPNSFKTEAKCESQCMRLVGNGNVSEECTDYSTCSVTCGQCTLTRNCTPGPDNSSSCSGIETKTVELPPCGQVLFRLNAGGARTDIYNGWVSGNGTTSNTSCINTACPQNYRYAYVDHWMSLLPETISITLLKNGTVVQFITFNATGSNLTNWFTEARVIATSWSTLGVDSSFYLGPGDSPFKVDLADVCLNPRTTYLRVFEVEHPACSFQLPADKPVIVYHPLSCKAPVDNTPETMAFADTMVITFTH